MINRVRKKIRRVDVPYNSRAYNHLQKMQFLPYQDGDPMTGDDPTERLHSDMYELR